MEWDADDRGKLVAYLLEKNERCDMCGTASWEWNENRFAYEPVDSFCHGCYLKSVFSEREGAAPGTTVTLVPVTQLRKAQQKVEAEKARARQRRDAERGGGDPADS